MKPNILLITGDHTRSDVLAATDGTNGSASLAPHIRMPNVEQLAADGLGYRHCFSPNPICVPARAAITTGRYPHRCTGVKTMSGRIGDDQPKLAEHFSRHGYTTTAIGKLHYVPYAPPDEPRLLHGFQYAELCEEGRAVGQFDPHGKSTGIEDYHDFLKQVGWGGYERSHGVGNNDVHPGPVPFPAEYHEEAWVASRAIHRIQHHTEHHREQPFMLWASFTKPHPPYDPPEPWNRMYDPRNMPAPIAGEDDTILIGRDAELARRRDWYAWNTLSKEAVQVIRAHYAGMMSFQDAMIGRIIGHLKQAGLYENTIIIYTADHGDLLGDFGCFFKSCMFDASVKVPFVLRAPQVPTEQRGQSRDQLIGLQDILPTLCSLAGVPAIDDLDGRDLSPTFDHSDPDFRDCIVSQTGGPPMQKCMLRTNQWKYVYCQVEGTEELYDVTRRDAERQNLAEDAAYGQTLADLRRRLIEWCRANGDEAMLDGDQLAVSSADELPPAEVQPRVFGWRRY